MEKIQESSGRRERKKLATYFNILHVGMNLFEKRGFDKVSMQHIADRCDISKVTLYKYFPTKETIVAAHWHQSSGAQSRQIEKIIAENLDTRSRLEAAFRLFMHRIMHSRNVSKVYINYRMQYIMDRNLSDRSPNRSFFDVAAIVERGRELGEIRLDIPARILLVHLEMLALMQSLCWLKRPERFSLQDSSKLLVDLFMNGGSRLEQS